MELFGISKETVRQWAIEFAQYLSPSAAPGQKGKHRQYTEDDLTVFALIAEMKERGVIFDEIHLALTNGQRGTPPGMQTAISQTTMQMVLLEKRVTELSAEVERLLPFENENIELRALLKRTEEQLASAQEKIDKLNREIGRLEK